MHRSYTFFRISPSPTGIFERGFVVWYKDFSKWKNTENAYSALPEGWEIHEIGKLVNQLKDKVNIVETEQYDMIGVKWYGEGLFHRETVQGDDLSSSYVYPLKKGTFVYNRLFAWKESFAIVTDEFDGKFVSNEFPRYEVNTDKVLPEFLYLFCLTKMMQKEILRRSVGSSAVSRNRLREEIFESIEIVLPPVTEQKVIVNDWKSSVARVSIIEENIKKIALSEEKSILELIGLNFKPPKPRKGAFAVKWDDLYRWDTFYFREDFIELNKSIKSLSFDKLGNVVNFTTRPWSEDMFDGDTFKYIEISAVNKEEGIIGYREIDKKNPPSRATTLIKTGDILLSTTRPYLGAFAVVPEEYNNCVCSSGFSIADSYDESRIKKDFLMFFLKSQSGLRQMEQRMTGGLYPAITQNELENIMIPIPDIALQEEIIVKLKETQKNTNEDKIKLQILKEKQRNAIEDFFIIQK